MIVNLLSSKAYAIDKIEPYAKWITIGLALGALVALLVLFFVNKKVCAKVAKYLAVFFVFYALIGGIVLLSLELAKKYSSGYLEYNWVNSAVVKLVFLPLLITLVLGLVWLIVVFIVKKKNLPSAKMVTIILGCVCALAFIVSLILMATYHNKYIVGDGYYDQELNGVALYLSAGLLVVLSVVSAFLLGKGKGGFDTKTIAFAGICVALSFVLSYIKLWEMPQGGSVTLVSMLPIMIFAYVHGTKKGVFVGMVYGLLQAIQDPWLIHPAQFLLDYPIAFSMVGFCGILGNTKWLENLPQIKFTIGAVITGVLRFACHVLSGVFAFGAYAVDEGQGLWAYSLAYNSFVFVDIALVIVAGILVFSSKAFQKTIKDKVEVEK